MVDFRSEKMPSADGFGRARAAWDAYARAVNRAAQPVLRPVAESVSASIVADLMGFWLLWQLHGGYDGLLQMGMSRASIFRKVAMFRKLFGAHPDAFELPGVTVDVQAYLAGSKSEPQG